MKKLLKMFALLFVLSCQENTIAPVTFGTLSGILTDNEGAPIFAASIATIPASSVVLTDSAGQFIIESIPAGEYTVTAEKSGFFNQSANITISSDQNTELQLSLRQRDVPTSSIQGQISDAFTLQGVGGANITTHPPSVALITSASGAFTLDSLPIGNYSVKIQKAGYITDSVSVVVSEDKQTELSFLLKPLNTAALNIPLRSLPGENSTVQADSVLLSWGVNNRVEGGDLLFDVFLYKGENAQQQQVASRTADTTLLLENLEWNSVYFWKVIAYDQQGNLSNSDLWSFRTMPFPDLSYLFTRQVAESLEIFGADASLEHIIQLTDHPTRDAYPRLSPDGARIAFISEIDGRQQLYVMRNDGGERQQVTTLPVAGYHNYGEAFCWSPDGDQLLYSHYEKLYRINRDGTGLTEISTAPSGYHYKAIDWSGTREKIVVQAVSSDIKDTRFYLMDEDGSGREQILDSLSFSLESPSFSVDGNQLLFTRDVAEFESPEGRQLDSRVLVLNFDESSLTDLSTGKSNGFNDQRPRFSPNGAQIIFEYTSNVIGSSVEIWRMGVDGENRTPLFTEVAMPDW